MESDPLVDVNMQRNIHMGKSETAIKINEDLAGDDWDDFNPHYIAKDILYRLYLKLNLLVYYTKAIVTIIFLSLINDNCSKYFKWWLIAYLNVIILSLIVSMYQLFLRKYPDKYRNLKVIIVIFEFFNMTLFILGLLLTTHYACSDNNIFYLIICWIIFMVVRYWIILIVYICDATCFHCLAQNLMNHAMKWALS